MMTANINSGGCLENAIAIGKSLTSLGPCWLDEDTFLGKLAMLGQLTLAGKPNITLGICCLSECTLVSELSWKAKHYASNLLT